MKFAAKDVRQSLDLAVVKTLELMAFAEIAPLAEAGPDVGDDSLWAAVDVCEPRSGRLVLIMSRGMAADIARLIHGSDDEDIAPALVNDALGELANTVAGRCLASLVPEGSTFRLALPEAGPGGTADLEHARHYVDADEEWVLSASLQFS